MLEEGRVRESDGKRGRGVRTAVDHPESGPSPIHSNPKLFTLIFRTTIIIKISNFAPLFSVSFLPIPLDHPRDNCGFID